MSKQHLEQIIFALEARFDAMQLRKLGFKSKLLRDNCQRDMMLCAEALNIAKAQLAHLN
jgi:hypothetical protein